MLTNLGDLQIPILDKGCYEYTPVHIPQPMTYSLLFHTNMKFFYKRGQPFTQKPINNLYSYFKKLNPAQFFVKDI